MSKKKGKESLLDVRRQNIAGSCQQTFCFQKFVDKANNVNFHLNGEGDDIKSRLSSEIFSILAH